MTRNSNTVMIIEFVICLVLWAISVETLCHFKAGQNVSFFFGAIFSIMYFEAVQPLVVGKLNKLFGKN